jgi:hypothetical protein
MRVTVLIEARCDCREVADVARLMMEENDAADIAVILRIGGFDVASQCHGQDPNPGAGMDDCLF